MPLLSSSLAVFLTQPRGTLNGEKSHTTTDTPCLSTKDGRQSSANPKNKWKGIFKRVSSYKK